MTPVLPVQYYSTSVETEFKSRARIISSRPVLASVVEGGSRKPETSNNNEGNVKLAGTATFVYNSFRRALGLFIIDSQTYRFTGSQDHCYSRLRK